ncbi:MAG: tetraacyldisaccharide 4'-kinase [Nitrospirae bacterium]|nr:tetraacyldisaccharide 4'-kinase [Nitrospirota bacterium]MBI3593573.1 tetraacyldisaccharide 4'-kinase [Nitrospirota bacterium]
MKTETYTSTRQWFYTQLKSDSPQGAWRGVFFVLYLLSMLFGAAVQIRISLYQSGILKSKRLPTRVMSVGNISAGGTGKTPAVLSLARFFQREDFQVAVLSRGYKRISPGRIVLVSNGMQILVSAAEAGEEAYFLAKELKGVIVAVGKNRFLTGQFLLKKFKIDLIILDDGYQHLGLYRDTNILLLDGEKPFGNGYLLPRGILREPASAISRASLILLTRKEVLDGQRGQDSKHFNFGKIPTYSVFFIPDTFKNLITSEAYSSEKMKGKTSLLVSGIGNPKSFRDLAEQCEIKVVRELVFPDHHCYQMDDFDAIYDIARSRKVDFILTTDKDAVKLVHYMRNDIPIVVLKLQMKTGTDFPWIKLKEGKI